MLYDASIKLNITDGISKLCVNDYLMNGSLPDEGSSSSEFSGVILRSSARSRSLESSVFCNGSIINFHIIFLHSSINKQLVFYNLSINNESIHKPLD